jgi:hypothetical protein
MYTLPKELVREIILKVDDPKGYGNSLVSGQVFYSSLYVADPPPQKKRFTKEIWETVLGVTTTYFVLPNGKREGPWKETMGEFLRSQGEYVNDEREGLWKFYYRNQLMEQGEYKNGKRQGVWKWSWY